MIRILIVASACTIALLQQTLLQQNGVASLNTPTQTKQESSPVPKSNAEEQRIQGEVAEIMAIREQLGGGVAASLGDLSLEMPGKRTQQKETPEQEKVRLQQERLDMELEFRKQLEAQSRTQAPPSHATRPLELNSHSTAAPSERQEAVRHAARMLEEAAAILEEASEFDHADHVRKSASELWKAARKP